MVCYGYKVSTVTDAELVTRYQEGQSISVIARHLGWHYEKTRQRLLRAGVVFRSNAEAVHLARKLPDLKPSEKLIELVDGVLLGDGHLERNKFSGRLSLSQRLDRSQWVEQVRHQLEEHGLLTSKTKHKKGTVKIRNRTYQRREGHGLRTRSYSWFAEQHTRWYPNGTKRIPFDVRLTPTSIAHWWFGDGGVGCNGYHARFSTDGFPKEDIKFLLKRLHEEHGWEGSHTKRNRILLSKAKDRENLLELVTRHTPDCFQYKVQLRTGNKCHVITEEQRSELLDLRRAGWSYGKLKDRFGMSKSGVSAICAKAGLGGYTSRKPK